jgi:hypothetical protein
VHTPNKNIMIEEMAKKFLTSPEGQKMITEFLLSDDGKKMIGNIMKDPKGKENILSAIKQILGALDLPDDKKAIVQNALNVLA